MAEFDAGLRERTGTATRALEFAVLTAARSGEVRGATWAEIDLDAKLWVVPAERMKAKKEHPVPLSSAATKLLQALPQTPGSDLLFPAVRGGQLSDMSLPLENLDAQDLFPDLSATRSSTPPSATIMIGSTPRGTPRGRSVRISIRLPGTVIAEFKSRSTASATPYQTLIIRGLREWLSTRRSSAT